MKARDAYLYFDSQLQPKDKLGLSKDDMLMKEFDPEGRLYVIRKDHVLCGSRQDKLQEQLSEQVHSDHDQEYLQLKERKRSIAILFEAQGDYQTAISDQ